MTYKLLKLLNEKIIFLKEKKEQEEVQLEEIKKLNEIIKALKNDPFSLCDLDDNNAKYVSKLLDLGNEYFDTVKKHKVIYEGAKKFGKESIPQIGMVESFIEDTKTKLDERKLTLSDEVAKHQYTIIQYEQYSKLNEEILNPEKIITKMNLLFKLLDESLLSTKEKNDILLEINIRNNNIYEKLLSSYKEEESPKYDDEIKTLNDELNNLFNPTVLNNLKSISDLLSSCENVEEINSIIEGWKYQFGDESLEKIIDGLINLKKIDFLIIKEIVQTDNTNASEDLIKIESQIKLLEEYKNKPKEEVLEEEIIFDDTSVGGIEQALMSYEVDPLKTTNCVLFICDSVLRDIKSIGDDETMKDIFLLIEQLKNDNIKEKKKLNLKGNVELLKPKSLGRQARVVYTRLIDNIYGILYVGAKKSDNPKDWITTLNSRIASSNVEGLRKVITSESEVLDYYVTRTVNISEELKKQVSNISGNSKELSKVEGAKK